MRKLFMLAIFCAAILGAAPAKSQQWQPWATKPDKASAVYYVAGTCGNISGPSGGAGTPALPCSDSNDGLSWGTAKATLEAAQLALPATGGTIYVAGGSYTCGSTLIANSNATCLRLLSNTSVIGIGPGPAIFTASAATPDFGRMIETADGASNVRIIGLTLNGNNANVTFADKQNYCVMLKDADQVWIRDSYIHDCNGSGIFLWGNVGTGTAYSGESIGTGDGTTTGFQHTLAHPQIKPGSVSITVGANTLTDDTYGKLSGTGLSYGSVDYATGHIGLLFSTAPANLTAITVAYNGSNTQGFVSNFRITNNYFEDSNGAQVGIISAWRGIIAHNTFSSKWSFSSVHFEPNSATGEYGREITVSDNTFSGLGGTISITAQVQSTLNTAYNVVANNTLLGGQISVARSPYTSILGNVIDNSQSENAIVAAGRDYLIEGNTVQGIALGNPDTLAAAIVLDSSSSNDTTGLPAGTGNSVIAGNKVSGADNVGIEVAASSGNTLSGNSVQNVQNKPGGGDAGIFIATRAAIVSNNNIIIGNSVNDTQTPVTTTAGIQVASGTGNILAGNWVSPGIATPFTDTGTATIKFGNPGVATTIPGSGDSFLATLDHTALTSNQTYTLPATGGTMTEIIASGTAAMTTAAIAAGACGTTVTVAATGVATTDTITWAFNAAPAANPAELVVSQWPTAGNVNFQYCNPTAASVTPNAATLNWRVMR